MERRNRRKDITKEILEKLYFEEGLSEVAIAKRLNASLNTIKRRFIEYNIPKRDRRDILIDANKNKKNGRNFICPVCGKMFYLRKARIKQSELHFCSVKCSTTYYKAENARKRKNGQIVKCEICGKEHYKNKSQLKQNHYFCSRKCMGIWHSKYMSGENHPNYSAEKVNCPICGKEISVIQTNMKKYKKHYCSVECMAIDYQERFLGPNSPSYKDGNTKDRYYGPNWKKISEKIRERDNHECQRCHIKENELPQNWKLDVHHINPLRNFDNNFKEANHDSNLITLCSKCHGIVENRGIDFNIRNRIKK